MQPNTKGLCCCSPIMCWSCTHQFRRKGHISHGFGCLTPEYRIADIDICSGCNRVVLTQMRSAWLVCSDMLDVIDSIVAGQFVLHSQSRVSGTAGASSQAIVTGQPGFSIPSGHATVTGQPGLAAASGRVTVTGQPEPATASGQVTVTGQPGLQTRG